METTDRLLKATSQGQITLPKNWRSQFKTSYFSAKIRGNELVVKPTIIADDSGLVFKESFVRELKQSMKEIKEGKVIPLEKILKKYGI